MTSSHHNTPIDLALRQHFFTGVGHHIRIRSRLASNESNRAPHPELPPPPQTSSCFCMLVRMHRRFPFFFFLFFFYSSQNCDKELHSLKDSSGCNRPHSVCSVPSSPLAVHDLSPVDLCRWNLTPQQSNPTQTVLPLRPPNSSSPRVRSVVNMFQGCGIPKNGHPRPSQTSPALPPHNCWNLTVFSVRLLSFCLFLVFLPHFSVV